jgi:hypothetical protein
LLRPLLIIGVGGAGGKTIRAMKQELNRILESSGYTDGIPAAWQFLQIDTTRDGIDFPAPLLHQDEFHCVVPQGTNYSDLLGSITHGSSLSEQQRMFAGWVFPAPPILINTSPRQDRAIGRLAIMATVGKTLQAIQASISKMQSPTAMAELAEVAHLMGAISPQNQPQAFIVSSLGGGSGSGMFLDVAELLKRATSANWGHDSISLLYTPEVFKSIVRSGSSISKNTLGAMNELIASQWVGISEESKLLYTKLGLVAGNRNEFGSRSNILIGTQNSSGYDIANGTYSEGMDDVFLNIGEALAGVVSNDEISDLFFYRVIPAIWGSKGVVDVSGLCPENFYNPTLLASGIGFGKITLGTDKIVDYVADKLTKHQVEQLLWPEATLPPLEGGITLSEVIQSKADEVWPNFLLDSGLDERGSQNQIVDALLPEQAQERSRQFVNGIIDKNKGDTPRPFSTFTRAIWSEWESESSDFLASIKNEINGNAQKWLPSIQEKLREQISNDLSLRGYAVLSNLVERLEVELRHHVMPELLRNHKDLSDAIGGFDQHVFNNRINEIAVGVAGLGTLSEPFFPKLSQFLTRVLGVQINSYVNALAASLVQDMLSFFIPPLKEQLNYSRFTLQKSLKSDLMQDGSRNPFMSFPRWGSGVVPDQYKAKSLERTLIDPQDYESTYEFYAGNDAPGEPTFQMSIGAALQGKKLNHSPGDHKLQSLVTVKSPWITSVREAQGSTGAAASKSEWYFHTDISELSERNRRWLKNEDSTFGKFINMSIREYVNAINDVPQIRSKRVAKFVGEFEVLLRMAQPLITLNPKAMAHVVSVSDGGFAGRNLMKSNGIPFSASSEVGQGCIRVLQQNGFDPANHYDLQDWFHPESNTSTIFAFSALQNKLPAWAFASLTEPILEQVAHSKVMAQTWRQFWEGRRSRPLIEAIPFETEIRRSIITGWFVASLFGMRKVWPLAEGRTVQIWNPTLETPGWSAFPSPLLNSHHEDLSRDNWVLPQLLVSAGIALAEFGKSGSAESINGYRLLKYLGREVTTSMANRDMWDANGAGDLLPTGARSQSYYLKNWVISGEMPDKNLELLQLLQESLASSDSRSAALIQTVEVIRAQYNDIWNEFSSTAWHSLPETWELREDIDGALNDIARYVSELRNSTPSNIA